MPTSGSAPWFLAKLRTQRARPKSFAKIQGALPAFSRPTPTAQVGCFFVGAGGKLRLVCISLAAGTMAPMQVSLSSNEISRSQHASPAVAATLWAERPPSGSSARRAGHILIKFFAPQARNLRGCGPPFSSRSEGLRPAQEVADHAAGDHLPHDWREVAHGA